MGTRWAEETAVVFPGQGSQAPGLGAAWVDHPAWSVVEKCEEATGRDLSRLLLTADADDLVATDAAQLTVFLASLVAWEALRTQVPQPVAFAGHSLGQVTALTAAGALPLEDGARLAVARADATRSAADEHPGGMLAVLGSAPELTEYIGEGLPPGCWPACDNAPGQVVLAGTDEGLSLAESAVSRLGGRSRRIDVAGAFHTPLMMDAADQLAPTLGTLGWRPYRVPVVHNADARGYRDTTWAGRLMEHLMVPVRWRSSMATLADLGVTDVLAVGPATSTATLVKRCIPDARVTVVREPSDLETALEH